MTSTVSFVVTAKPAAFPRSSASLADHTLFCAVFGLLLFGPLAFGAVEPWSISIMQVGAGLLFALWVLRQVTTGYLEVTGHPLFGPMLLFASLILCQFVTGQTAYPAGTLSNARLYCTYGLLCFLVVQCLRRTSQLKILAWAFSAYGFALALFALLQGIASNGKLYWLRTPQSGGWIYGSYVNHNHYAGLMEMLIPIPLVVSFLGGIRGSRKTLAGLAAAVMASTIFLSGSRGGMLAIAVQLILLATFLFKRRKTSNATSGLIAFLVVAFGFLAWSGGGELAERVASIHSGMRTELSGGTRLTIDRDTLKMFAQKPLLGWGAGTFSEVYPQFSSLSTDLQVGAVHNDYLQLLAEMGALGFAAALWFLFTLFRAAREKLNRSPSDINTAVTLAATLGIAGILVHGCMDFNLQIPANAALFYVLCVLAAMKPGFHRHHRAHRPGPAREAVLPPVPEFRC